MDSIKQLPAIHPQACQALLISFKLGKRLGKLRAASRIVQILPCSLVHSLPIYLVSFTDTHCRLVRLQCKMSMMNFWVFVFRMMKSR